MSAHGYEMDMISETTDDTESCPPMDDDIIFEADRLHAKPIPRPDDTGLEWDPPMDDDIIFEADRLHAKPIPSADDTDLDWDPPMPDDIVFEGDRLCKLSGISTPDDTVVESNSLDEESFHISNPDDTVLTPIRRSSAGSESSSKPPSFSDWVPASPASQVYLIGSPPASPSPQVSPAGSPNRAASSSKRPPFSDKIIWGNICPRGVDPRMGTGFKSPPKTQVFGSGHSNYGYGSIINMTRKVFEEAVQAGDDAFNKGQYKEALQEYDKAVHMKPRNVNWKLVRADTLVRLGRFVEAFNEYHEAYQLDPNNGRLHHRLSLFHLRLGVFDMADLHMTKASPECKEDLRVKIENVKDHLIRGGKARKDDNWIAALKEVDAVIAEGADSSQPILAFRAEMLLRLDKLDQAEETITRAIVLESKLPSLIKFLGMPPEAYLWAVNAQIELALGRFENAVAAANRAHRIDQFNDEISAIQTHVRLTCMARITGNKHYRSGDYLKAREEYKVGLKYAKSNVSLLNNLAACHWQLETWENCIEICNQVLQFQPDNAKALLRRADSYAKLEKWANAVKDYEAAIKIYPEDKKTAEALKESQAALQKSQVTELAEKPLQAQGAVKESQAALEKLQVTELADTPLQAQGAVKESQAELEKSQVNELADTPFQAQGAVKESQAALEKSQVTELADTPLQAQGAVKESQVEDVSED